jgi:hypothetical protein
MQIYCLSALPLCGISRSFSSMPQRFRSTPSQGQEIVSQVWSAVLIRQVTTITNVGGVGTGLNATKSSVGVCRWKCIDICNCSTYHHIQVSESIVVQEWRTDVPEFAVGTRLCCVQEAGARGSTDTHGDPFVLSCSHRRLAWYFAIYRCDSGREQALAGQTSKSDVDAVRSSDPCWSFTSTSDKK